MSMSLSTLSSPLEQEPNSHAFFIGCVAKYCLIVSNVLISIIIMFLRCKITNFLSNKCKMLRLFLYLQQFNVFSRLSAIIQLV